MVRANDGGACVDTCSTDAACKSWDFSGSKCPAELSFTTDSAPPTVIVTCNDSLRIFATDTRDVDVTLSVKAPASTSSVHASAKATINEWKDVNGDRRRVMQISTDGGVIAEVHATTASGSVVYSLCQAGGSACQPATGTVVETTPHRVTLDVTRSGKVTFSIDCVEIATFESGIMPLPNKDFDLSFGDTDGQPLDGNFDDVVVDFNR